MTDLISSLADSIIALINSKPASPTKEEVEGVLRHMLYGDAAIECPHHPSGAHLWTVATDVQLHKAGDTFRCSACRMLTTQPSKWQPLKADCQEETAQRKPGHYAHYPRGIHPFDVNPPCVACGSLYREWGSTTCLGPKADQDAMAASAASHSALLRSSAQFSERMERRAVEIFNDLPERSVCCPGSTDGKHSYSYDINNDVHRCPCGAQARLP